MKTLEQGMHEKRRQETEALIARHMEKVFQRLPMVCGFCLAADLKVAELSVFTWPGCTAGPDLYRDLLGSLVEFLEDLPDAVPLMRGRTFARAVQ